MNDFLTRQSLDYTPVFNAMNPRILFNSSDSLIRKLSSSGIFLSTILLII